MSGISQNPKTFLPTGERIKKNYISILAQDIGAVNLFYTIYSYFSPPGSLILCCLFPDAPGFQPIRCLPGQTGSACPETPDSSSGPFHAVPVLFLFPAGILAALFPENAAVAIICQRLPYPVQLFLCTYDFHAQTPLYHHTLK